MLYLDCLTSDGAKIYSDSPRFREMLSFEFIDEQHNYRELEGFVAECELNRQIWPKLQYELTVIFSVKSFHKLTGLCIMNPRLGH